MNDDGRDQNLLGPTLEPRRSSAHRSYVAAAQRLLEAVGSGPGVLVLTGPAGVGKTTLITELGAWLEQEGHRVERLARSRMESEDLLRLAGFALGLQAQRGSGAGCVAQPQGRVAVHGASAKSSFLIIDEAQDLAPAVLRELCRLGGSSRSPGFNLQILLSGRGGLWRLLERPENTEIRARILVSCRLGPLSPEEMQGYAVHALRAAGWSGHPAVCADALDLIYSRTGGVPRLITLTLGHLLLSSRLDSQAQARELGMREVEAALAFLGQDHPQLLAGIVESLSPAEAVIEHPLAPLGVAGMPAVVGQGDRPIELRRSGLGPRRAGMVPDTSVREFQGLNRWDRRWALTGLTAVVVLACLVGIRLVGGGYQWAEPPVASDRDRGTGYTVVAEGRVDPPASESGRFALEPLLVPPPLVAQPRNPAPPGAEAVAQGNRVCQAEQGSGLQAAEVRGAEGGETGAEGPAVMDRIAEAEEPAPPETRAGAPKDGRAAGMSEVEQLLTRAERALASDRLTVPADDNAYRHYRAVLALEPGNPRARAGVRRILARYQGLAQQRLRKGDLSGARRFASRGLALAPADSKLLAIKRKASKAKAPKAEQEKSAFLTRLASLLRSGRTDRSLFLDQ